MVSPLVNTVVILLITTIVLIILYKLFVNKGNKVKKNSLMIIGPSLSGKTTFFYYLLGNKTASTVVSMQINKTENFKSSIFTDSYDIIDVPGTGYYKDKIIDMLPSVLILLLFVDSTDKNSINQSAEYLYDLLNSDKYSEELNILICCNKQDCGFPKSKKMIENELSKELENLIKIKQKNNLEDKEQIGTLFQMKGKFSFKNFNNVQFLETDQKSEYENLIKKMKDILETA